MIVVKKKFKQLLTTWLRKFKPFLLAIHTIYNEKNRFGGFFMLVI